MTATIEDYVEIARHTPTEEAKPKRGKKAAATASPAPGALSLTISQTSLAGALAKVTRAVSIGRSLPILSNVKLTATNGELELAGTDLGIAYVVRAAADVANEGAYTVPAKLLTEFVGTLPPGQPVTLRLDGTALRVECGRAKAQIKGAPIDDFPTLPVPKEGQEPHAHFDAAGLTSALALAAIAPSQDALLGLRNAVHLRNADTLRVEATNGDRLSIVDDALDVTENAPGPFNVILPLRGAQEIGKLAVDGQITAWLLPNAESPNILAVRSENVTFAARLLEGTYYDLDRVTPKNFVLTITLSRTTLLAVTRQAMLFATSESGKDGKADYRTLICRPAGSGDTATLAIAAQDAELGAGDFELSATVDGAPFPFALNGYYLRDVLNALDGDTVRLQLSGQTSPVLITDPERVTFRYVVMPIHVVGLEAPKTTAPAAEEPEPTDDAEAAE